MSPADVRATVPAVLVRLVAAATLAAAAYAVVPAAPSSAAACSGSDGVTVVVDFHQLDGGVQTACVADGGGDTAAQLFAAAGFALTYVQRTPGFVCRVSGKPADDPCVNTPPADAYWGLFWSDGRSGSWSYSTTGAASQHVPDGGYAGFSWQGSSSRTLPGYRPAPHLTATASPTTATHAPSHAPAHQPSGQASASVAPTSAPSPTATTGTPSASTTATKRPDRHPHRHSPQPSARTSAAATASPTDPAEPTDSPSLAAAASDPSDPGDGGLPGWLAPAVVAILFGAAGAVAVVRRRQGGP